MHLALLTSDLEAKFWDTVEKDRFDYFFFIYDWQLQKEKTQIILAYEADAIVGLMLIYNNYNVQLRGTKSAIQFLLQHLPLKKAEIQAPIDCQNLLTKKYPIHTFEAKINLMTLKSGEENQIVSTQPIQLNASDANEIANLMRLCYPEIWSEVTEQNIKTLMATKEANWLGIKTKNTLFSFGYALSIPKMSHILWIATNPQYENRGYATSITSSLLKQCQTSSDQTIIYVMDKNNAAKKIYSKVGFKLYKSYFLLKI